MTFYLHHLIDRNIFHRFFPGHQIQQPLIFSDFFSGFIDFTHNLSKIQSEVQRISFQNFFVKRGGIKTIQLSPGSAISKTSLHIKMDVQIILLTGQFFDI